MKRFRIYIILSALAIALGICVSVSVSAAEGTNAPGPADFASYKVIPERNIFNPRRTRGYVPTNETRRQRPRQTDWFALTGTMTYDKGPYAFFEGSSSDLRKVAKPEDTIAGFKVVNIEKNMVKLQSGTNELELKVGMQLRKSATGEWASSERTDTYEAPANYATSTRVTIPGSVNTNGISDGGTNSEEGILLDGAAFPPGTEVGSQEDTRGSATTPAPSNGTGITETDPVLRRLAERAAAERGDAPRQQ
jgi:hypothetical protein